MTSKKWLLVMNAVSLLIVSMICKKVTSSRFTPSNPWKEPRCRYTHNNPEGSIMANRADFSRSDRVRKAIIREFSDILASEIKEPRLINHLISVTDAEVSNDMRHAKVFVSIMGDEATQKEVMEIL